MAEDKLKKPYYPDVHLYKAVAQDQRLSLEARGLYVMMMSLPDDWVYSVGGLSTVAGCGKDKIRRLLGELEEVGYLLREQDRRGGKFSGNVYILQSHAPPLSGNPTTVKPDDGKSRQRRKPPTGKTDDGKPDTKYYGSNDNNNPPFPPKGEKGQDKKKRKSKYALAEEAKPILRAYVGEGEKEDKELAKALADFIEIREAKGAVNSAKGIRELLRRLDDLSKGDRTMKLELIRQSIANSWKSVFPLKGYQAQTPPQPVDSSPPPKYHIEIINGEEVAVPDA